MAKALLNAVAIPTEVAIAGGRLGLPVVGQVPWVGGGLTYTYPFEFDVSNTAQVIVVKLRAPRVVLAPVIGFPLASAGTVMQGFFRNPLADPPIIGVSTGAAVGAVTAIVSPASWPPSRSSVFSHPSGHSKRSRSSARW